MSDNKEKLLFAKQFDGLSSITDTGDHLIVTTHNLNSSEPIITYKTKFDDNDYIINLCDEDFLYRALIDWRNLSLVSFFQMDHDIIYDDTFGMLEKAQNINYLNTLKVAKELLNKNVYYIGELYNVINKMINYKDIKWLIKENNRLSEDFFKKVYIPLSSKSNDLEFPIDILEFNNNKKINNPQKLLKKYYRKK